jgi:hypothetical protein
LAARTFTRLLPPECTFTPDHPCAGSKDARLGEPTIYQRAGRTHRGAFVVAALICSLPAFAQQSDVGYTALQSYLGAATPTGAGVNVVHTEASLVANTDPTYPVYAPDTTQPQFAGKSFVFPGTPSTSPSSHATGVGSIFYGAGWLAYGIDQIACYEADEWMNDIDTPSASAPINASRLANDSWVGSADTVTEGNLLRIVDRQTQLFEWLQVAGMPYGSGNPLIGGGFNVVAVGETAAGNFYGSDGVDSTYVAGRARPDLVAPMSTTSDATPLVASAAALLIETGHNGAAALSSGSTSIAGVGTVYDAERAMTIKVALMAGASRLTNNNSTSANVTNYAGSGCTPSIQTNANSSSCQTSNGLDWRYGAGQLDVFTSYQIIAAGEQHSMQDSGGNGTIGTQGFDYDAAFGGGNGSNSVGTYRFTAAASSTLTAALGWYVQVSDDANLTTALYSLTLTLLDMTDGSVVSSASAVDNTQNLWVNLTAGHQYQLRVNSGQAAAFLWQYALAWNIATGQSAPVPPTVTASSVLVDPGDSTTLSATPVGSGTFTYQWYQGTSGNTSTPVAGATGPSFTTPPLSSPASYWVQITSAGGAVQNSATVAVSIAAAPAVTAAAPLPLWALAALAAGLIGIASARPPHRWQVAHQ